MGRPKLNPSVRLDSQLCIAVTTGLRDQIRRLAEAEGMSPGAWVRRVIKREVEHV